MKRIYLDYAASTPVDAAVTAALTPYFSTDFGNPGSVHFFGQQAIAAVDNAREIIATTIGAGFREIIFTASATEANNLALRGAVKKFRETSKATPRVIVSSIEHESILETARDLEKEGVEVVVLPVDREGVVDIKKLKENLTPDTVVVSLMYASNEIGTIEPIQEVAGLVKTFRGKNMWPLVHTDAAQALQFFDCNVKTLGVDLMTLSSHKIYGPKGAGALYCGEPKALVPTVTGGGQEFGLRSGTENVPAIAGFAKAVELAVSVRESESSRIAKLTSLLEKGIKELFPKAQINGSENAAKRTPNMLNVYFPGHLAQDLLTKLDLAGVAASAGSACRSRALEASYVVEALGYSKERARSSIRFSLGRPTTEGEIKESLKILKGCLK